jgi:hypothetical protein
VAKACRVRAEKLQVGWNDGCGRCCVSCCVATTSSMAAAIVCETWLGVQTKLGGPQAPACWCSPSSPPLLPAWLAGWQGSPGLW